MVRNVLNIFMEHDFNILMIFGMYNFDPYVVYKYTCAAYDCFCAPESHIIHILWCNVSYCLSVTDRFT